MTLRLNGDSSGFTEIKAADAAGDNSIKLPASNGSANQLLQNGGTAGELQYTNAGGGLHYDSSGRLLVGTSSVISTSYSGSGHRLQIANDDFLPTAFFTFHNTGNENGYCPYLDLVRGRGTQAAPLAVAENDDLGYLHYFGHDGTNALRAAEIKAVVDGTVTTNSMPGRLVFATSGAGSNTPTQRISIDSNGALKLLAGCPGIDFSAIQTNSAGMSSEMLDSYEEGTWTPSIGGNTTYNIQQGTYVRVGRLVMINYYISIDNHGTGSARTVSGLPFTAAATTGGGAVAYFANLQQNISYLSGYIYNGTTINFYGNATPDNNLSSSVSVFRGGAAVQGSNVYMAA